jgi:NAD(P)-dependent dehydrogenase (short-subunit alcohol dehydrogenase family)
MEMQLQGEIVVVVGAAQGIGHAIATAFAQEKARVVLLDIAPRITEVAAELGREWQVETLGIPTDITQYDAVLSAARTIGADLGTVSHVICAAGMGSGKFGFPFWNLDPSDWDRVWKVNMLGAVHVAHAFAPALAETRHGTLLFLASIAGQIGSQTDPPYSAAKAGVINFAQCAAKDLAPYGVRVNAICPGMVQTALNRSVWQAWNDRQPAADRMDYEAWGKAKVRQVAPLGQWQEPAEIAAMAVYLASPHARNITGQTLNVDGGQVMHS